LIRPFNHKFAYNAYDCSLLSTNQLDRAKATKLDRGALKLNVRASERLMGSSVSSDPIRRELKPRDTAKLFGRNWHDNLPSDDRREFRRARVTWESSIIVNGEEHPAVVTDVSLGGARAKTTATLSKNTEVLLDIHGVAKLKATLVWKAYGEIGLQFLASPSMVSEKLPSPYVDLL
jgi:hypothetical protein